MRAQIFASMLVLGISLAIASSPFIEKRSKRGPSIATLQEQCCEGFGEFLNNSACLLQSIGAVQKHAVGSIAGYAKNEKESWCYTAAKSSLSRSRQKLIELNKKVEEVMTECDALLTELNGS